MDRFIQRPYRSIPLAELPTYETVLKRLDECVGVVVSKGFTDYETLEQEVRYFCEDIIDCGVRFVISEESNNFTRYMYDKNYRTAIMTKGKEKDFIKSPNCVGVFIASCNMSKTIMQLKYYCEDLGVRSRLYAMSTKHF